MQVNKRKVPLCRRAGCGHPKPMHEHFHHGGAAVYCGYCGSVNCPQFRKRALTPADFWFLFRAGITHLRAIR